MRASRGEADIVSYGREPDLTGVYRCGGMTVEILYCPT